MGMQYMYQYVNHHLCKKKKSDIYIIIYMCVSHLEILLNPNAGRQCKGVLIILTEPLWTNQLNKTTA